jgi:drug/metabolite transporter (DMT)-like permease
MVLIAAGAVWGITFALAKIITGEGAHPVGINLWQTVIAALVLGICLSVRKMPLPLDRSHVSFYLICGLCGTVIPGTLLFYCAIHLPAGVLAITIATVPILTFIAALFFRIEVLLFKRIGGVLLGVLSIVLISAPETSLPDAGSRIWVLIAVLASLSYCVENMFIALKRPPGTDVLTPLCGMQCVAAIILGAIVLITDSGVPISWIMDWRGWMLVAMALISVVAYSSFIYLINTCGPVFASQMAYVITISGVFWGILILAESHTSWVWLSLLVMLAGLFLVQPRRLKPANS